MISEQKNLKYYLHLHLINPFCAGQAQQQANAFVCPKYEHPSGE